MMQGSVNTRLEPTLRLQFIGARAQPLEITTIIDTGYNGSIALPPSVVSALALLPLIPGVVQLADGTLRAVSYYRAEVSWDGRTRTVRVLCVDGDALAGTALLQDHKLEIEFRPGGDVSITALP